MKTPNPELAVRMRHAGGSISTYERALGHAKWLVDRVAKVPESLGYDRLNTHARRLANLSLREDVERSLVEYAEYGLHEALEVFVDDDNISLIIFDRYHNLMEPKNRDASVEEVMAGRRQFSRALQPIGSAMRSFGDGKISLENFKEVVDRLEIMRARKFYQSPQHVALMGKGSGGLYDGTIRNIKGFSQALSVLFDNGLLNLLPHLTRAPDFHAFQNREPRNPSSYRNAYPAAMVMAYDKTRHELDVEKLPLAAHGVIFETLLSRIACHDFESVKSIAGNFDLGRTYDILAGEKPIRYTLAKPLEARVDQFTPLVLLKAAMSQVSPAKGNAHQVLEVMDVLLASGLDKYVAEPGHLAQIAMMSGFDDFIKTEALASLRPEFEKRVPYKNLTGDLKNIEVFSLVLKGREAAWLEYKDRLDADRSILRDIIPKLSEDKQVQIFTESGMKTYHLKPSDRKYATSLSVAEDRLALDLGL